MLRKDGLKPPHAPAGTSALGQVAPLCSPGLRTQGTLLRASLPELTAVPLHREPMDPDNSIE